MLEVRDLRTHFLTRAGAVKAVNGVSFDVPDGRIVGLVGESGCGKTATVRSILGLVPRPGRVVGGSAVLDGVDLVGQRARDLRRIRGNTIGFIAQNPFGALNPILRIHKQFHNVVRAHRPKVSRQQSRTMAAAMLEAVGIADPDRVLDGHAHELSGGMAQRVIIAMSLVLDPHLVIADEPTTALDVTIQRQILELIRSLLADGERSMLLVTHDLGVVAQYCDDVVVMYAGKVVETGPVVEVFDRPAHPYTLALLEAIPRRGQRLVSLKGRVPDLIDYPTGCPYAPRCRFRFDRCDEEAPELTAARPNGSDDGGGVRLASCHLRAEEVVGHAARAS